MFYAESVYIFAYKFCIVFVKPTFFQFPILYKLFFLPPFLNNNALFFCLHITKYVLNFLFDMLVNAQSQEIIFSHIL